jgi:hypothetical protein
VSCSTAWTTRRIRRGPTGSMPNGPSMRAAGTS